MKKSEREFKFNLRFPAFFSLASLLLIQACAGTPSLVERYREVDSDQKIAYLAYYPDLTPEQRNELLAPDAGSPRVLIESWKVDTSRSYEDFVKDPRHHTIKELEIVAAPEGELNHFKAIAHYADGRKVDVTADSVWKATPPQLEMKDNVLHYSCLHSEAVVSADFIGETGGSLHFQIEKPLENLELRVSDSYLASDQGFNYKLDAIVHCKDGTHADVSCQSDWSSKGSIGEVSGCGNFSISQKQKLSSEASFASLGETFQVTVRYAGLVQSRILPAPKR
jgi:hypothetical protein